MMRRAALCFVAVASAGCSLLLSTSDLGGEPGPDSGAGESSTVTEAGRADAPGTVDGGTDALVRAPDANARFCETLSPAPKFCADFDGTGTVDEGWDNVTIDPAGVGSVTRDTTLGRDRSSLLTKLTAPQSCSYARPAKTFETSGLGTRVSFSFRPSSPWVGDAIFLLMNAEGGDCGILFHLNGGAAFVHFQYGQPEKNDFFDWSASPKADVWTKIDAAIDTNGMITIALDGNKVLSMLVPDACAPGTKLYVAPGLHCENDVREIRFDDFVVDYP